MSLLDKIAEFREKIKTGDIKDVEYNLTKEGRIEIKVIFKFPGKAEKSAYNLTIPINPQTNVVPYEEKIRESEKEAYLRKQVYYSRYDQLESIAENQLASPNYEKIISKIKPVLVNARPLDLAALRHSATICRLEDEGGTTEDKIRQHRNTMRNVRANTIYNWLRCVDQIFEKEIFPLLETILMVTKNDKDKTEEMFIPFWDSKLSFHPNKIFVPCFYKMNRERLLFEMNKRLLENQEPEIRVYSRASRNDFARNTINHFLKQKSGTVFELSKEEKYNLGTTPARTFIIKKK